MIKKRKALRLPPADVEKLRSRLQAAEDTVRALQAGEVDALVVTGAGDEHVVTLQGTDLPYRILLDQMFAGAVTLTPDGTIVYSNRRFADIVRTPLPRVIGAALRRFVAPAEQPALAALLARARRERIQGEIAGQAGDGTPVPMSVTFAPLRLEGDADLKGVIGVVVDDTERKRQEGLRTELIQQAITAQDEERRRIARELHDETGQSLTALLVGLRTIEDARTTAEAGELAQRLRGIVAQTLDEVGRLSRGLHPSVLDAVGLATAVTRHAQEFARLYGIAVDVRIERPAAEALPPLVQTTVYRVLQEALTNVAKHAAAGSVRVRLGGDEARVELRVQDDGSGFNPAARGEAATRDWRGLGLQGMRERAALLGGSVEVDAEPGAGTTITAYFPVNGA